MRTIVISDAHGHPSLIENAVRHAGDFDRLVFAGDALDIGPDPRGVLRLLEEYGAECLIGNHDACALLGIRIHPQDEVSFTIANENRDWMMSWDVITEVDGVTVSHAGVPGTSPMKWDMPLNLLARYDNGPLWIRPGLDFPTSMMRGPQVFGHTPREAYPAEKLVGMEADGLFIIDPYARAFYKGAGFGSVPNDEWFRYALIVDGVVSIVEPD